MKSPGQVYEQGEYGRSAALMAKYTLFSYYTSHYYHYFYTDYYQSSSFYLFQEIYFAFQRCRRYLSIFYRRCFRRRCKFRETRDPQGLRQNQHQNIPQSTLCLFSTSLDLRRILFLFDFILLYSCVTLFQSSSIRSLRLRISLLSVKLVIFLSLMVLGREEGRGRLGQGDSLQAKFFLFILKVQFLMINSKNVTKILLNYKNKTQSPIAQPRLALSTIFYLQNVQLMSTVTDICVALIMSFGCFIRLCPIIYLEIQKEMQGFSQMSAYNQMQDNLECNCFGISKQPVLLLQHQLHTPTTQAQQHCNTDTYSTVSPSINNINHMLKKSLRKQNSSHTFIEHFNQPRTKNANLQFNKPQQERQQHLFNFQNKTVAPEMMNKPFVYPVVKKKESLKVNKPLPISTFRQQQRPQQNNNNMNHNIQMTQVYSNFFHQKITYVYPDQRNAIIPQKISYSQGPIVSFSKPKEIKSSPILKEEDLFVQEQGSRKTQSLQDKLVHIEELTESQKDVLQLEFQDETDKYQQQIPFTPGISSKQYKSQIMRKETYGQSRSNTFDDNLVMSQKPNTKKSLVSKRERRHEKEGRVSLKRIQDVQEIESGSDDIAVSEKSIVLEHMLHGSMVELKIHYSTDISHLSSINKKSRQQ